MSSSAGDELLLRGRRWETRLTATGMLGRRRMRLPVDVRVRDGFLEWKEWSNWRNPSDWIVDEGCLERFLRLDDPRRSNDEDIVRFARRYGALSLDEHGLPGGTPISVPDPDSPPPPKGPRVGGKAIVLDETWNREPVEAWRAWARYAKVVLVLGLALHDGRRIDPEWRLRKANFYAPPMDEELPEDAPYFTRTTSGVVKFSEYGEKMVLWYRLIRDLDRAKTLREQRTRWAWDIEGHWLNFSEAALLCTWTKQTPVISLDRPMRQRGVAADPWCFPIVAGQLVATVISGGGMVQCTEGRCGDWFRGERQTKNRKCPDCKRRANSQASQKWKATHRAHPESGQTTPITTPNMADGGE